MGPPWPHIAVVIYYTYKILYLFSVSMWLHIGYVFYLSIYGFDAIICYPETQILHFGLPKERLSILH